MRRLLEAITSTRCRVNAIEKRILPRLQADECYIDRHLAEREERLRQKWVKDKRERSRSQDRGRGRSRD